LKKEESSLLLCFQIWKNTCFCCYLKIEFC
jgi:hypothetical protein